VGAAAVEYGTDLPFQGLVEERLERFLENMFLYQFF
jgi:hypothetical protein